MSNTINPVQATSMKQKHDILYILYYTLYFSFQQHINHKTKRTKSPTD